MGETEGALAADVTHTEQKVDLGCRASDRATFASEPTADEVPPPAVGGRIREGSREPLDVARPVRNGSAGSRS